MSSLVVLILVLASSYLGRLLWRRAQRPPYPPGPKPSQIERSRLKRHSWLLFTEWAHQYGPIVSFSLYPMLAKPTIILNTPKAVSDLLEARSAIYSDRPFNYMVGELAERKWNVFNISSSSPRFKIYRRILQSGLNSRAAKSYRDIQEQEVKMLLKGLSKNPEDFVFLLKKSAVAVMLKLAYGFQIGGRDDEFVKILDDTFALTMELVTPGKYAVELFPFLRFLPTWFPGTAFKRHAYAIGKILHRSDETVFGWTQKQIATGHYIESFISKLQQQDTPWMSAEDKEDIIKWCSAGLYVGGGDTTASALVSFMLVMQLHPEVQQRAQADIDRVVAHGRLPTADDYSSLPYLAAIVKEILRWGPVAPLGLPHTPTQDDVYDGYFIPKGSKVFANIWAITHNEEMYPDPMKFDPQRHLGTNPQPDPFTYVFGFGRRSCPGAHFAEMSLFLTISNVLAVFNISKARTPGGEEVEPEVKWSNNVTTHPEDFSCLITVRSPDLLALAFEQEDPTPDRIDTSSL